mgnify:CR=1 FL=1
MCLFFITGCEKIELNLDSIKTNVEALKTNEVDRVLMTSALSTTEYFDELTEYYDWDLKKLKIDKENINEVDGAYDFNLAASKKYAYFVGSAKNVDELKKDLDKYFKKYDDVLKEEYEGYIVYIASMNNEEAFKTLKDNAYANVFNGLTYLNVEDIETMLGINKDLISEHLVGLPSFITSASQYIIIKPERGKAKEVKELMSKYMESVQEQWDTYLPAQAELVRNRLETEYGDYLIYIISQDNEQVINTIKK